jgi:hypothetical protein
MLYEQNAWLEKYVKNAGKRNTGDTQKKGF